MSPGFHEEAILCFLVLEPFLRNYRVVLEFSGEFYVQDNFKDSADKPLPILSPRQATFILKINLFRDIWPGQSVSSYASYFI